MATLRIKFRPSTVAGRPGSIIYRITCRNVTRYVVSGCKIYPEEWDAAQPEGGVIVVKDIEITDEEGQAGGSGFDVTVDGWGEFEDIELPLR